MLLHRSLGYGAAIVGLALGALLVVPTSRSGPGNGDEQGPSSPTVDPVVEKPASSAGIFFNNSDAGAFSIEGTVRLIRKEGLFIKCAGTNEQGLRPLKKGDIVFVQDPFPGQGTFGEISVGKSIRYKGFAVGFVAKGFEPKIKQQVLALELR